MCLPGIKVRYGTYLSATSVHPGKPVCKVRLASTTPRQSHSLCYMGYKIVNPAHRIGGSRPFECVGVQGLSEAPRRNFHTTVLVVLDLGWNRSRTPKATTRLYLTGLSGETSYLAAKHNILLKGK